MALSLTEPADKRSRDLGVGEAGTKITIFKTVKDGDRATSLRHADGSAGQLAYHTSLVLPTRPANQSVESKRKETPQGAKLQHCARPLVPRAESAQ